MRVRSRCAQHEFIGRDFEDLLRPYVITELQRTGRVALNRLERNTPRLHSVKGKVG